MHSGAHQAGLDCQQNHDGDGHHVPAVDVPHWELFDTDPVDLEDALVPCSHSACVKILEQV